MREGQHSFAVRATDAAGNTDSTPAEYAWEIDLTDPEMAWTQRPGNATGPDEYDTWVTNDPTPTWAYTFSDKNLVEDDPYCDLYDDTRGRPVFTSQPCPSPMTSPFELADGDYGFEVWQEDKANNGAYEYNYVEVDTVAPEVLSTKPTGRRVSPNTKVVVTFDDDLHDSKQFVNIYKGSSNTPLAVDRYVWSWSPEKIELDPKKSLKRNASYTVKVGTGVNDGANNMEAPYSWTFKTKK